MKEGVNPPSDVMRATLPLDLGPGSQPVQGWTAGKCLPRPGVEEAGQGGPALLWKWKTDTGN